MSTPSVPAFVYGPFIGLRFRIKATDQWTVTGILEENSEIKITPIYAKRGKIERFLGCQIEVTSYDIECTESTRAKFTPFINQEVFAAFSCQSAGFADGPFTYSCYPDHIAKRGMRVIHKLSGFSFWPGWVTFLDGGWDAFRRFIGFNDNGSAIGIGG